MGWNSELAHKALNHIKAHPEQWNQKVWTCGTAHCFAGHVSWIANGPFEVKEIYHEFDDGFNDRYDDDPEYVATRNGVRIDIRDEAEELLNLGHRDAENLFNGANTLERLEEIIAEYDETLTHPN